MGAQELLWVIFTTVFSNLVSGGAVPIMNLKEVVVAVGAALQVKVRKRNTKNLKERIKDFVDLIHPDYNTR